MLQIRDAQIRLFQAYSEVAFERSLVSRVREATSAGPQQRDEDELRAWARDLLAFARGLDITTAADVSRFADIFVAADWVVFPFSAPAAAREALGDIRAHPEDRLDALEARLAFLGAHG